MLEPSSAVASTTPTDAALYICTGIKPTVYQCGNMAWSSPEQNGGFDFDFVTTPPDRLCCAICLHVLRDPHQTDCGHQFCLSCITKAYRQSQVCPVCKKIYSIFQDKIVAREVRGLQVRCSKKNLGCEWVGELGSYCDTHIHQCGFINVSCMYCQQLVPKRLITKHQDLLCPLRKYDCDYCRTYISTYEDVTKNHWPICEFFPVPCPNDCPKGSVPRNCLMEHIRNDCKVKKEAAEMKSQHTKLLEKLHYLQEQFEKKNDENRENERKLKEQARQVEQFEQEVAKRDKKIRELEEQVRDLQSKIEELQQLSRDEGDGSGDHNELDTVSQRSQSRGFPRPTVLRERAATQVVEPNLQANLLQDPDIYLKWSLCQPLPENMVDGHAVVIGEFVYAGGGTNGDVVYKYHIKNNNWATLPKANRQKFAMVYYNSQLILIGGKDLRAEYCNSLLVWDEQTHMWTDNLYPPMDTARMQPAALSHREHIIVAGGKNALLTSLDNVEVFDGNEWYDVAPLPVKIHSAKAAFFEDKLYLMGGNGQNRAVYCAPLESLNENCPSDVWGSIPDTDFPNATVVTFRNTLTAIGGSTAVGSTNAVRGYFTGTKTWLQLNKPLPRSLYAATAVVTSPEELLVIGGRSRATSYKSVYKAILKYS